MRSPHPSLSAFQLLRKNVISQSPIAVTAKKILTRAGAAAGTPLHMFMYQCNQHMQGSWLLTVQDYEDRYVATVFRYSYYCFEVQLQ